MSPHISDQQLNQATLDRLEVEKERHTVEKRRIAFEEERLNLEKDMSPVICEANEISQEANNLLREANEMAKGRLSLDRGRWWLQFTSLGVALLAVVVSICAFHRTVNVNVNLDTWPETQPIIIYVEKKKSEKKSGHRCEDDSTAAIEQCATEPVPVPLFPDVENPREGGVPP